MTKLMLLAIITPIMVACEKPPEFNPPNTGSGSYEPDESNLDVIWKVPLSEDERYSESRQPLTYEGDLICNSAPSGNGFSIWRLDGETGELKWRWNNFLSYPMIHWANHQFIYEDKYVINNNVETDVIDLSNGTTFWQYLVPGKHSAPNISEINGNIFHKHTSKDWPAQKVYLVKSPINYMDWDTIFTLDRDSLDGYSPGIQGPSLWINPQGDSIFVFQNRSYKFGDNPDGQIDLYVYNWSEKKIEFIIKDIEPTGNSNALPPFIEGTRVYLLGNRNLHCVDLVTQQIIWQKGFPGFGHHLMLSNLIVVGNKLIVKPDNDRIYAFNKYDGTMIWYTSDAGSTPSHMKYYKGMVFYTSEGTGKLFAVSIHTGKIIWAEDSPHDHNPKYQSAGFQEGVAINEDLGYIYAQDKYFMMCFKAPKPY